MNSAMLELVYGEACLYPRELELRHPRILEKIVLLWHTPQMEGFFRELMVSTRADRQGFSHEVASELFYLEEVFEGTRNLPKVFDENPLAQLNNKPTRNVNFEHSPQDFINMRSPSDDSPWASVKPDARQAIESLGYPCTANGFLKATGARDLKAIGLFLHCDINIDTCDERGWSPLFFAAFNGNLELAKLFLEFGANVNLKDHGGFLPSHWAAYNGHAHVIKHFVTHGAEVNAQSLRGWTALMMAAMNGHLSACSALLASGAETGLVSGHGWTALQKASFNHQMPVIKLFLSLLKDHVKFFKPSASGVLTDLPSAI
ncbi:MAG: ankyrin repeat domain-containing protein [Gammaproteobacteria bacterium]|nr:ankyrin repeat domain-containing protein [Gammaproteobacteria bacterium]MBU1775014.1 ankyrin repeat domain-containing protein [Gammaproteobacteria bacterium]